MSTERHQEDVEELTALLAGLSTRTEKINALQAWSMDVVGDPSLSGARRGEAPGFSHMQKTIERIREAVVTATEAEPGLLQAYLARGAAEDKATHRPGTQIHHFVPCANTNPLQQWECEHKGIRGCSVCQLVSYCSGEPLHSFSSTSRAHRYL